MSSSETSPTLSLDARQLSVSLLNEKLSAVPDSISEINIVGCQVPDLLAPGFRKSCRVFIHGDLGDFCLCGTSNVEFECRGRAGCGLGEAMESGSLILQGDAGDAAGAFNRGGLIAIHGNTGRRTAVGMCGGEMVVKGSIGSQGALGMTAGALLVLGKSGVMLGQGMQGGMIYIRGEVESMAPHLEESRLKESDRLRIGLLLLKAGLKGEAKDFRVLKIAVA